MIIARITMANIAITDDCRTKLAYVKKPDEYLRDTVERLVDSKLEEDGIKVPEDKLTGQ